MSTQPNPQPEPICSVVIVTWNRLADIQRLIPSIFAQTIADRLEVLIADNASNDGTVDWLARECPHPLRILAYDQNRGASVGRNVCIRAARAPYLCFVDSDAVMVSPEAIEKCVEYLESHPDTQAVSVPVWRDKPNNIPYILGGYATPDGHLDGLQTRSRMDEPMFLSTCFAVWRRSVVEELRGFDPWYFWGMEDMDMALRAFYAYRRRNNGKGSPFHVIPGYEILHEMSRMGRLHEPFHFAATFRRVERERLYMVCAYGGLFEFFRVMLRAPFRQRRIDAAWERPLTRRQRLKATLWYPMIRLLALPKNLIDMRRDFIAEAPEAREVRQARS